MLTWIKKNWLSLFLFIVVVFLLVRPASRSNDFSSLSVGSSGLKMLSAPAYDRQEYAPSTSPDRLVITDTSLSLVVKDVPDSIKTIQFTAESLGGFLVSSNLNQPESAASGTITVRVPTDKLNSALDQFKNLAIKVVSQNTTGRDVTDQYQDLDARLSTLTKTKTKFESILDQATRVTDILEVQRELINLQSQIDSITGQQDYLKKSADLSKIVVYLSTDELSLPYTPDQTWRPAVVFKTAVRSLLSTFQSLASLLIKLFVFTPIWLPLLLFVFYLKKRGKI